MNLIADAKIVIFYGVLFIFAQSSNFEYYGRRIP